MNLQDYIMGLSKFLAENPECAEMQVISAKDDEGNGFNQIHYSPSKGVFTEDKDFHNEPEEWGYEQSDINAVCVN